MFQGAEKRAYKRIQKPFIVRFRIKPEAAGAIFPGWDVVITQNLSAGGILFNYDDRIELTSLIDLKINFPTMKGTIDCTGRVLRVEEVPRSSRVRIAAVFTDIDEEVKKDVEEYADLLLSDHPDLIAQ